MSRAWTILMLLSASLLQAGGPPALPFYDWDACPGEGCGYGRWAAGGSTPVFDTYHEKRQIVARLSRGELVQATRGVVITWQPGTIRIDQDMPEKKLKAGATIFTYAYRGEGESAVWVNGSYHTDYDISFTKWPDGSGCQGRSCQATYLHLGNHVWWAQVKLKTGQTGWVNMDQSNFAGVCQY